MDCFKVDWGDFYLLETAHEHAPPSIGIYAMFETRGKTHIIDRLLYMGKAKNIRERIRKHKHEWTHTQSNEVKNARCFCFGEIKPLIGRLVSPNQLGDIESILINNLKPEGNDAQTKKGYVGKPILVISSGKHDSLRRVVCHDNKLLALLAESFTKPKMAVKRKRSSSW